MLLLRDRRRAFLQVEGLFAVLMYPACQVARSSFNRDPSNSTSRPNSWPTMTPANLVPVGRPLPGCDRWVILPWDLETHATADHPGWVARYELVRPLPRQHKRVVFRRVEEPPAG